MGSGRFIRRREKGMTEQKHGRYWDPRMALEDTEQKVRERQAERQARYEKEWGPRYAMGEVVDGWKNLGGYWVKVG
jgi:hypothetical protein